MMVTGVHNDKQPGNEPERGSGSRRDRDVNKFVHTSKLLCVWNISGIFFSVYETRDQHFIFDQCSLLLANLAMTTRIQKYPLLKTAGQTRNIR
jgi:hypothetical protein